MNAHSRGTTQRQDYPGEGDGAQSEELYLFIPSHLRHHFKLLDRETTAEQERQALEQASPVLVPVWLDDGGVSFNNPAKLPTLSQVQRQVVNACHACLSDCDIYLAMHEELPSPPVASPVPVLRFAACSPKSSMLHRTLPCSLSEDSTPFPPTEGNGGECNQRVKGDAPASVSTAAMVTRQPVVIRDIGDYHECPIVVFAPTAVPTGPFACFPLIPQRPIERQQPGEDNGASLSASSQGPPAIGVLSIDACRKAERQRPEAMTTDQVYQFLLHEKLSDAAVELRRLHIDGARLLALTENDVMRKPALQCLKIAARKKLLDLIHLLKRGSHRHLEHGHSVPRLFTEDAEALAFLTRVADMTGVFLDGYRAVHWSREMASATRDQGCSVYDVLEVLVRAVARVVSRARRIIVWKAVPSKCEISAVASSEVPEDRLQPFLLWEERLIKRVALYKETEIPADPSDAAASACGLRLLHGSVSKPVFFQPNGEMNPPTGPTAPVCETAAYNVTWANCTYQTLTWRQLRQLLPIRPMNAKHFQLKLLLQQLSVLSTASASDGRRDPLTLSDPNALVLTIHDEFRPPDVVYALEIDFPRALPLEEVRSPAMVAFLQRAVAITERSLACVHGRTRRRMLRELSIAALSQRFGGGARPNAKQPSTAELLPSRDALRVLGDAVGEILRDITENLPGTDVQVAELQPDGARLKFTFVGGRSTVEVGRTVLQRGQGVSFGCLDTKTPLVVDPEATPDLYKRLRRLSQAPRGQERGATPLIFVPLLHEDCAVGVLSVDSFAGVPKGRRDERHPERGVVEYLAAVGSLLATIIYTKRRSFALYELQRQALESSLRSPHQLFLGAGRALRDVMVGTWKVRLVEVDCVRGKTSLVYDYSEAEREAERTPLVTAVEPLLLRWKELLPDSVAAHVLPMLVVDASSEIPSALQTVDGLLVAVEALEHQEAAQRAELSALIDSRRSLGLPLSSPEQQRVQTQRVRDAYFSLLPPSDAATATAIATATDAAAAKQATRVANDKYATHALGLFLSTKTFSHALVSAMARPPHVCVFLAVSCLPQFHAECDRVYVDRVAEALARGMETCQARVERSRARVRAVERFRRLCEQEVQRQMQAMRGDVEQGLEVSGGEVNGGQSSHPRDRHCHRLSPSQELDVEALLALQRHAIDVVQSELSHPDVYIGLLEPSRDRLKYTSASGGSVMLGKRLKRGIGVSFDALDKQKPVVVARLDAAEAPESPLRRLRCFSSKPTKGPFIAVPVGHAGVLALDNLETYARLTGEPQPELGLVDFVHHVAAALGDALARVRRASRELRRQLRDQSLLQVMAACEDRRTRAAAAAAAPSSVAAAAAPPTPPLLLLHRVLQQLERALNGVNAYVGLVDPLCRCVRFVCATPGSVMNGQVVDATRSVSFHVFSSQQSVVVPDLRAHYRSSIAAQRLSTAPDASNASSASSASANQPPAQAPARWLKCFGPAEPAGAFVCVPIPFVGVLSVDSFPGAASGQYAPVASRAAPPEPGVVDFLEQVGLLVGRSIRATRASALRAALPSLFRGNRSSFPDLFLSVLTLLSQNLPAVAEMHAVQLPTAARACGYAWSSWKEAAVATLARPRDDGGRGPSRASGDDDDDDDEVARYLDERHRQQCAQCGQPGGGDSNGAEVVQLPRRPEILVVHCLDTRDVDVDVSVGDADGAGALRDTALVLQRVEGAAWAYDAELLREALPAVNALIQLANPRVQGIARRRVALRELRRMGEALEALQPAAEAEAVLRQRSLPAALELVAWALSDPRERDGACCDAYLGERSVFVSGSGRSGGAGAAGAETRPALRFVAASARSLMAGVSLDLSQPQVQAMTVVQSLGRGSEPWAAAPPASAPAQQPVTVVYIPPDARRSPAVGRGVTPLTTRPARRVFLAAPMGDDHVLCADSLCAEAATPAPARRVEADVLAFVAAAARALLAAIQATQWRASFARLQALRREPHASPRAFLAAVLDALRLGLVRLHSAQVLRLGEDFTRAYAVAAWLGAPTRRPPSGASGASGASGGEPEHLCYASDCARALLAKDIHFETRARLPMTNVPRTLDASRAAQQPAEGVEKRGAFATSCLAAMLDAAAVERAGGTASDARWALCAFHHDAVATDESGRRRWRPAAFTPAQRRYFFALAAVAQDVFVDVLRACALDSAATELAFVLLEQRELSAAAELVVVRVLDGRDRGGDGDGDGDGDGGADGLETRVLFSTAPAKHAAGRALRRGRLSAKLAQLHAPPRAADLAVFMTRKPLASRAPEAATVAPATRPSPAAQAPPPKPRGAASALLDGGRSLFRRRKGDQAAVAAPTPTPTPTPTPAEEAARQAAETLAPRQAPPVTLHVLLRAVEQPTARCADYVALVMEGAAVGDAAAVETGARRVKRQLDEALAAAAGGSARFLRGDAELLTGDGDGDSGGGGGGFLLRELLKHARARLRAARVPLEAAMRAELMREAPTGGLGAAAAPRAVDGSSLLAAAARAAVAAAGGAKAAVEELAAPTGLWLTFLRANTCDAVLALDPTDRRSWPGLSRARALLRAAWAPPPSAPAAAEAAAARAAQADEGVEALAALLRVCAAAARYLRHVESAAARARREALDAPATALQCAVRGWRARRELVRRRREFAAARAIQCAFRQHLARRARLFRQWTRAAERVQRAFRTWRARRRRGGRELAARVQGELRAVADRLQLERAAADGDGGSDGEGGRGGSGAWQRDMAAFDSFAAFAASRAGKAQLRREEALLHRRRRAIAAERERERERRGGDAGDDAAMWAELADVFELLDEHGSGELSLERVRELMARVRVPLDAGEAADVVAMMDSDGSGAVSLREFSAWLAHELPALRRRARDCGRLSARDWQWVVRESARAALRKRWRAVRAAAANATTDAADASPQ